MRLLRSLSRAALPALLLIAPCTSLASAQEHLKLADGTTLTGNATAYDDAMKVVSFTTTDGRDLLLRIDELDQRSAYMLAKSRVDKTSATDELRMANFARDIGLYAHAARHYKTALKLDPTKKADIEKEEAKNRSMAAVWAMAQAKEAADKGDLPTAERYLQAIVQKMADTPQAPQAAKYLDEYYTKNREARDDHVEAADTDNLLTTDLKRGKQYYDEMLAKNKEGLLASPSSSKADKLWQSAVKAGERALYEIDKVGKKKKDAATTELLASYRKVVNEQMIEVYTNMASAQTTRSSYQQAMKSVNQALAIDPKNPSAVSMRARVEEASSRSGRGWW